VSRAPHIRTKPIRERQPFGPGLNAHKLVAEVAIQIANEMWEVYARDNLVYKAMTAGHTIDENHARLAFIGAAAPRFLEDARRSLADCLSLPDDVMPRKQKDEILDALVKDTDLRANRHLADEVAIVPSRLH